MVDQEHITLELNYALKKFKLMADFSYREVTKCHPILQSKGVHIWSQSGLASTVGAAFLGQLHTIV